MNRISLICYIKIQQKRVKKMAVEIRHCLNHTEVSVNEVLVGLIYRSTSGFVVKMDGHDTSVANEQAALQLIKKNIAYA